MLQWLISGMAVLLWGGATTRFVWRAAQNPPPAPLLRIPGFSDWTDRALYRRRCAFNGQFLAVGERLLLACPVGDRDWEMVRWDLTRGVVERRWPVPRFEGDLQHVSGLTLPPAIAAALSLPDGRIALVTHGLQAKAPLRLLLLGSEGGVKARPLPGLAPGELVGFLHRGETFELVTTKGRLHRLLPGGTLQDEPLPGVPAEEGFAVESAKPLPMGWEIVYSGASDGARPPRYPLFLVREPGAAPQALGTLLDRVPGLTNGERLDLSPGNVLPVHLGQWPTHHLRKGRIVPLPVPPATLAGGLPRPNLLGTQVVRLLPTGQERLWQYSAAATGAPPDPGSPNRVIQRWRWFSQVPGGWIAGERVGTALRLETAHPALSTSLTVARVRPVLQALPASGGGAWLFDSSGLVIRIGADLSWRNRPGLGARLGRLWRGEHLEPGALSYLGGHLQRPDRWIAIGDRWALPVVLLGLPLILPLGGFIAYRRLVRRGEDASLRRFLGRPTGTLFGVCLVYLALSVLFLWRFWMATAAL